MTEIHRKPINRRDFLKVGGIAAVAAAAGPTILAGCGDDNSGSGAVTGGEGTTRLLPGGPEYDAAVRKKLEGTVVKCGFTPPVLSEFFDEMEHAAFWMLNELEERFGIQVQWERAAPSGDFETVEEHFNIVQNWTQAGFDAIFICSAVDLQARNEIFEAARSGGTSVYEFNQPNELWDIEEQNIDSSITYDNVRQSGYAAGTYIAEKLNGEGGILQVWGPSGHWAEARQIGLDQALAENPGLKVLAKADGGYVRDKGFDAAQNLLERYPDANAIYGENEEMALGGSQAIDVAGLKHFDEETGEGILTIGADGLLTGFEAIKNGRLTATIYVGTVEQGITMPQTLFYNRLLGQSVDIIQNQPCAVVDKTNVDIYESLTDWALASPKEY